MTLRHRKSGPRALKIASVASNIHPWCSYNPPNFAAKDQIFLDNSSLMCPRPPQRFQNNEENATSLRRGRGKAPPRPGFLWVCRTPRANRRKPRSIHELMQSRENTAEKSDEGTQFYMFLIHAPPRSYRNMLRNASFWIAQDSKPHGFHSDAMGKHHQGSLRVNLCHERFAPTSPLNLNLPPLQTHPQAADVANIGRM